MAVHRISRRTLLLATAGLVSLGGCLEGEEANGDPAGNPDDRDGPETESPTDSNAGPNEEEIAADHIENARTEIQAAFDEMEQHDTEDFDNGAYQSHLRAANSELDESEAYATDGQRDDIRNLRDVVNYLAPWGDAEENAARGLDRLEPGEEAYRAGREYFWLDEPEPKDFEASSAEFDTAKQVFDEGQTHFERAAILFEESRNELEGIDPAVFDDFENAVYEAQFDHLESAQYLSANLNFFMDGHAIGSQGWRLTAAALEKTFQEEYEDAKSVFEEGQEVFEDAPGSYLIVDFVTLYDSIPFLEDMFEGLICENEQGVDMMDHFIASMEAAIDGDQSKHEDEMTNAFESPMECH